MREQGCNLIDNEAFVCATELVQHSSSTGAAALLQRKQKHENQNKKSLLLAQRAQSHKKEHVAPEMSDLIYCKKQIDSVPISFKSHHNN